MQTPRAHLDSQIDWLENQKKHCLEKVTVLIRRAKEAYSRNDLSIACVFSCELAEKYKIAKTLLASRLALDHVRLELDKVSDIKDLIDKLRIAIGVLSKVTHIVNGIYSKSETELDTIIKKLGELLWTIEVYTREPSAGNFDCEAIDNEAEKILSETMEVAGQKMKAEYNYLLDRFSKLKTQNNT